MQGNLGIGFVEGAYNLFAIEQYKELAAEQGAGGMVKTGIRYPYRTHFSYARFPFAPR